MGFLIGNGSSREGFDLDSLRQYGPIVGCNWIVIDFIPDVVATVDSNMLTCFNRMIAKPFDHLHVGTQEQYCLWNGHPIDWTRNDVNGHRTYDSGIVGASYLAKRLHCRNVVLIGVDFFRLDPDGSANDIYHGRLKRSHRAHAWNQLFRNCPQTTFTRIGEIPEHDTDFYSDQMFERLNFKESFDASDFI